MTSSLTWQKTVYGWSAHVCGHTLTVSKCRRGKGRGFGFVARVNQSAETSPAKPHRSVQAAMREARADAYRDRRTAPPRSEGVVMRTFLTEEQIELAVERKVDAVDARFMAHSIDQAEYDAEMEAIGRWADVEFRFRRR